MTTSPPAVHHIPLIKLVPSPTMCARHRPRQLKRRAESQIRARGFKQNLVVHPSAGEKSMHAVTASSRRLKALQEFAAEGGTPPISRFRAWSKSPRRQSRPR